MKLDLHVHIKRNSSCAKQEPHQVIDEATANGIDGLVLLDHKYHVTEEDLPKSNIKLFRGAEVHIKNKKRNIADHVIIVTKRKIPFPLKLDSNDVHHLENFKRSDTLIFLAHPFRKSNIFAFDLTKFSPDAIEILSPNTPKESMGLIESIGFSYNMKFLSCSDSHKPGRIGKWYIDTQKFDVYTYEDLVKVVKSGLYELYGTLKSK